MENPPKIGALIEEVAHRDAIHIAVAPVTAGERLFPGNHVGFVGGGTEIVSVGAKKIGIIDPFLKGPLQPGQRCYLFLYPNSIVGLRHEWTHPAFQPPKTSGGIAAEVVVEGAKEWLKRYAEEEVECSFEELIQGARAYIDHDEYMCEGGKWEGFGLNPKFWTFYEMYTGKPVPKKQQHSFFSCAC